MHAQFGGDGQRFFKQQPGLGIVARPIPLNESLCVVVARRGKAGFKARGAGEYQLSRKVNYGLARLTFGSRGEAKQAVDGDRKCRHESAVPRPKGSILFRSESHISRIYGLQVEAKPGPPGD